jgi:hypothetical protein
LTHVSIFSKLVVESKEGVTRDGGGVLVLPSFGGECPYEVIVQQASVKCGVGKPPFREEFPKKIALAISSMEISRDR